MFFCFLVLFFRATCNSVQQGMSQRQITERLYDINPGLTLICESVNKVVISFYRDDFQMSNFHEIPNLQKKYDVHLLDLFLFLFLLYSFQLKYQHFQQRSRSPKRNKEVERYCTFYQDFTTWCVIVKACIIFLKCCEELIFHIL